MNTYMIKTAKGFVYLENGSLIFDRFAKPILATDLMEVKQLLKKAKITNYYIGRYNAKALTIEDRIMSCQARRYATCKKCLHGYNEMNDCELLTEFERSKK